MQVIDTIGGLVATPLCRRCCRRRLAAAAAAPADRTPCCCSRSQVPMLWFGSFMAFNGLAWIALRIINRKRTIKHPRNKVYIKAA